MRQIPSPTPLCVLVVDDDHDVADSLVAFLRLCGHRAIAAYDGPGALEVARAYEPDAVLLDLSLPRLDGCEVARKLRDRVGLLVAATGRGENEDWRRCREAGFDHFLLKPFDPDELARLLQKRASNSAGDSH